MRAVLFLLAIAITVVAGCKRNKGETTTPYDAARDSATTNTPAPANEQPGPPKPKFDYKAKYVITDTLKSNSAADYQGNYSTPESDGESILVLSCSTSTDADHANVFVYEANLNRFYEEPGKEAHVEYNTITAISILVQQGWAHLPIEPPTASGLEEGHTLVFVTVAQNEQHYRGVWVQHVPKGTEPERSKDPWRLFVCKVALTGTGGNPCK